MKIYKTLQGFVIEHEGYYYISRHTDWDTFINREDLFFELQREIQLLPAAAEYKSLIDNGLLAPIQSQEVWASGVTYLRSRNARMEESKGAGGDNFYDRVYDAERPELFFKSTPQRVVGSGQAVRIRKDSKWNVPEPELTLFINSKGQISGYTVGNDMSSRDIEGENPLYLPQAKTYDKSAAIGPGIAVFDSTIDENTKINLEILRFDIPMFSDSIEINRMKRKHSDLVEYLFREMSFPNGCFLMTGTGIVPHDDFTLEVGDVVKITIDGIGTLVNTVEMK
ncbi:fumarylacetoacetate (FAA) hydrolase [Emticicia oligotrophica DSM 17448]|uniref:Fumarylacetoacetate (FAA) hydrolase n=1 Tax=Emticicia oligotrophica (strain DSM 17448 / CIP 109782 / MTCC 6937 / GPTSA100-15) TaxID=929562 RepID=A0ABN4AMP5_EMTOG|nr:fumarylacetoacetate hydrolase family protein [Emticicia oligotrophica]AFK02936.1 fumarylacetoacetate (FAA) hydrolase [Emticicia oligotrophica DSM 17448]